VSDGQRFLPPRSIEDMGISFVVKDAGVKSLRALVSLRKQNLQSFCGILRRKDATPYARAFSNELDCVIARLRGSIFCDRDN